LSEIPIEAGAEITEFGSARFNRTEKYLAVIGAMICFGAFWLAGKIFRIPVYTHLSASLLLQPTAATSFIVAAIVFGICVVLGALICGILGFDSGIFCAAAGLCALSARGGAMRYTLMEHPAASTWLSLILEVILLGVLVWAGTLIQAVLHRAHLLHHDDHRHVVTEIHESIDQRILALVANVIIISILMMFFAASDRKVQVLAAVAISSFLGTLAAYYLVPTRPSIWYWAAPILVAVIGYAVQYIGNPGGWQIGEVRGTFAALARPLPLDYAGSGVAASIVAYWTSRRWQHEREISSVASEESS
jgi:hypothetical protein